MYRRINDPKRRSPYDLSKHFSPPYPVLQFSDPKTERKVLLSVIPSIWLHRKCKRMYPKRKN